MKKKIVSLLLSIAATAVCAFGLSACRGEGHTHTYTSKITKEATCTEKGKTTYACDCGDTYEEEIPALGHDEITHEAQEATCTEIGWEEYVACKREGCDYSTYEEIPALGHDEITHEAQEATCTEIGWEEYAACKREGCDYSTYEEIPALGHDEITHEAQEATCTEIGWEEYVTCKREGCDYSTYEEIPFAHDFTIVTTAPTCRGEGYDTMTCGLCGDVEECNYTPAIPHSWVEEYSTDNSYHWYDCAACDAVKGKEEHIDDGDGNCLICNFSIGATEGIVYEVVDGKALVVGYDGTATHVRIAKTYNGVSVTEIAASAFSGRDHLTSVEIPDSVTYIGDEAFYCCSSLISVALGGGVRSIGTDAFAECCKLVEVINKSAYITVQKGDEAHGRVGYYALAVYNSDSGITESQLINDSGCIVYMEGSEGVLVAYMGTARNVVLPSYVTKINPYAFYNCDDLFGVVVGESVTSIGAYAFEGCDSLENVTFNDTTTWYRTYDTAKWENKTGGEEVNFADSERNAWLFYEVYSYYNFYKL